MDHKAIQEKLSAFYDNELEGSSRQQVESHLLVCQECRKRIALWTKASEVFFPKVRPEPSEFFVQQVMTRLKESETLESPMSAPWRIAFPWLIPALGLAAVLLIVLQPAPRIPLSMELLLTSSQNVGVSVLSSEALSTDQMLEFVMGGLS